MVSTGTDPVTIRSLGEEGVSSSRNAVLLRILEDVFVPGENRTACENRGSGIRSMLAALRRAQMSPPEFVDRIASFSVTFPSHSLLSDEMVAWISDLDEVGLTDAQCIGLAMMRDGEQLDNLLYRTATGVDSRVATAELQNLVGRELIVQTGSRRWARYELSERLTFRQEGVPRASSRLRPADRRAEILRALGSEKRSRSELALVLRLPDQTVRRWLTVLRKEGYIVIADGDAPQSRNARYRAATPEDGAAGTQQTFDLGP